MEKSNIPVLRDIEIERENVNQILKRARYFTDKTKEYTLESVLASLLYQQDKKILNKIDEVKSLYKGLQTDKTKN